MKKLKWVLFIGLLFNLSSCANTDSEDIKTSAFCARYSASSDGSNATISASWQVGCGLGGSYIELSETDSVQVKINSGSYEDLSKSNIAGIISYSKTVSAGAGDTVTIRLVREEEGSYEATATIPTVPTVSAPTAGGSYTEGDAMTFSWVAGTGSFMSLSLERSYFDGTLTNTRKNSVTSEADDGSYLSSTDFTATNISSNISATVEVTRNNSGSVPSDFEGGYFYAKAVKTLSITLTP